MICLSGGHRLYNEIGLDNIARYEHELLVYASRAVVNDQEQFSIGTADNKASVVSFNLDGIHAYDVGVILDQLGIAVRTGTIVPSR